MGDSSSGDVSALIEQLASADGGRRAEAAELLCRAGAAATVAVVPLVKACGDSDDRVREWAVAALEDIGPPPSVAIGQLTDSAGGTDPLGAYWAITLLGRSGQAAAPAVGVLAGCVTSSADSAVRERAAWALGKIGPAAAAAREALQEAAAQGDARLARLAREALAAIGP
jgi:hypothetical protein